MAKEKDDGISTAGSLNSQNVRMLRALVIAHVAACLVWVAGDHLLATDGTEVAGLSKALGPVAQSLSVGFLTLASLATIAMTNLVPRGLKSNLVHLRTSHPLPGCRAFSKYARSDDRIDTVALIRVHGTLPSDPKQQNALWYSFLIGQQAKHPYIGYNHRVYLLLVDSAALVLVLLPLIAIILAITGSLASGWILLALMGGEFLIAGQAARNAGVGLVTDVLALESHAAPAAVTTRRKPARVPA